MRALSNQAEAFIHPRRVMVQIEPSVAAARTYRAGVSANNLP
jgi:hypothetical protein